MFLLQNQSNHGQIFPRNFDPENSARILRKEVQKILNRQQDMDYERTIGC